MTLILSSSTMSSLSPAEIARVITGIADNALDSEIQSAISHKDQRAIEILTTERLKRSVALGGVSTWKQVQDLIIKQRHETHKLSGLNTFSDYFHSLRELPTGEGIPFWANHKYGSYEAYATAYRHFYEGHELELRDLARIGFGKLQAMNALCVQFDIAHDGQFDPDVLRVLNDETITRDDIVAEYLKIKRKRGEHVEVGIETPPEDVGGGDISPHGTTIEIHPNEEAHYVLFTDNGELHVYLDMVDDNGRPQQVSHLLGTMKVSQTVARPFIISLCQRAGVEIR